MGQVSGVLGIVLVVEDEHTLRVSVAKMLGKKGFTVIEASDGSLAIERFRANHRNLDAGLLDLTIPGASSHEVISEIHELRPDVKLILTSAYEMITVFPHPDVPEVAGFIRKLYHLRDLVQLLHHVLAAKREASA